MIDVFVNAKKRSKNAFGKLFKTFLFETFFGRARKTEQVGRTEEAKDTDRIASDGRFLGPSK